MSDAPPTARTGDAVGAGAAARVVRGGWRALAGLLLPGAAVGVATALVLMAVSAVASALETLLWETAPGLAGVDPGAPGWIVAVLVATGVAVGLVVAFAPGHAGPDPATTGLAAPPLPLAALPGLVVALVLMLGGGVSLGPENPILAVNTALVVAFGLRLWRGSSTGALAEMAFAGTLGAMFGTPVGAALALSELPSRDARPLWDRLYGPLVAASAGALTVAALGGESFALALEPYRPAALDVVAACVITAAAAGAGMLAVRAFPIVHRLFHAVRGRAAPIVAGGVVLGLLGAVGGELTLFKGLDQMRELTETASSFAAPTLLFLSAVKFAAMIAASASGFRGGRIFPSVFAAVAFGLGVHALVPAVPQAIAVGASLVGVMLAIGRSGWLALFLAVLMVGDVGVLPHLCVALLAGWLVVTGRPEMIVATPEAAR